MSAFQVGRIFSGGGSDIGFATSTDAGATWTHGSLPGLTVYANGTFDAADQIFNTKPVVAGNNTLTFAVPCTASAGVSYARFRLSSAGGLGATGAAPNGEVEDYAVVLGTVDFGDAPDSYGTTLAANVAGVTTLLATASSRSL